MHVGSPPYVLIHSGPYTPAQCLTVG